MSITPAGSGQQLDISHFAPILRDAVLGKSKDSPEVLRQFGQLASSASLGGTQKILQALAKNLNDEYDHGKKEDVKLTKEIDHWNHQARLMKKREHQAALEKQLKKDERERQVYGQTMAALAMHNLQVTLTQ